MKKCLSSAVLLGELLLLLFLPFGLMGQGIDSSLYNWVNQGHFYMGGKTFQRWPGHWWDTLATLRDVRNGGGGGGSGTLDTIHTYSIYHDKDNHTIPYIREQKDDAIGYHAWQYPNTVVPGDKQFTGFFTKNETPQIANSGSWRAAPYHYTGYAADTIWTLHCTVHVQIHFGETPRSVPGKWGANQDDATISLQFYIWDMAHACYSWITVAQHDFSDNAYPFPHVDAHILDTTIDMPLTNADWTVLKNGTPGYHPSPYTFGVDSSGMIPYRIRQEFQPYYTPDKTDGTDYPAKLWELHLYSQTSYGNPPSDAFIPFMFIDEYGWSGYFLHSLDKLESDKDFTSHQNIIGHQGVYSGGILADTGAGRSNIVDTLAGAFHIANAKGAYSHIINLMPDSQAVTWVMPLHADTIAGQTDLLKTGPFQTVKVIQPDSNIAFIQSNDTLKIRGTTGAGASAASFYTHPAERPPTSASSFNDEFDGYNGQLPDTSTKWKWMGGLHPNNTLKEWAGALVWSDTASVTTDFIKLLGQKITDASFTITAHLENPTHPGYAYTYSGIFVYDSTSARGEAFRFLSTNVDQQGLTLDYARFTGQKTGLTTVSYLAQREVPRIKYLKIEKTSGNVLNFWISEDGLSWTLMFTESSTTYVESSGTINWVGICIGCYQTSKNVTASFSWFRYNWTADFDPTLNH